MRRAIDLSYAQLEGSTPVDFDAMVGSGAASAYWIRWTDYAYWLRYRAGDTYYNSAQANIQARGVPAGPYLFTGAGYGGSATAQIDNWADATTVQPTWYPMYDLETTLISGNQLTDWVNEALERMTVRFGMLPMLYVGPFWARDHGMERPSVPHLLMVAEYPTTSPYAWPPDGWEARAYSYPSYGGGPDVPWDGVDWHVWQALDSAMVPGLPGRCDLSFVKDEAFDLLAGAGSSLGAASSPIRVTSISPPVQEDDFMPAKALMDVENGTVYACMGFFKHAIHDDAVRQAWVQLGLLEANITKVTPGVLAEMAEMPAEMPSLLNDGAVSAIKTWQGFGNPDGQSTILGAIDSLVQRDSSPAATKETLAAALREVLAAQPSIEVDVKAMATEVVNVFAAKLTA